MNNLKPVLSREEKRLLKYKLELSRKRVEFRRQEWFRYDKFGEEWRKPRGKHSKMREHLSRRPPVVDAGYRGPSKVRYLHPSGFMEVLVFNPSDIEKLNREKEAARISSNVGKKKRIEIIKKADEMGIRILNRGAKE